MSESLEQALEQLINEAVGRYDLNMEKLSFLAKSSIPVHPNVLNNFGLISEIALNSNNAKKIFKYTQIKRACCLGLESINVRIQDPSCVGKTDKGCNNGEYRSITIKMDKRLCKNIDNWEVMNKIRNNPSLKESLKDQIEPDHLYEPSNANTINKRCDNFMMLYCKTLRHLSPDNDDLSLSDAIMDDKTVIGGQECACINSKLPELMGNSVPAHCIDSKCNTGSYRMGGMFGECNVTICQQNIDLSKIDAKQVSVLNNSFSNKCGNRDLNAEKVAADAAAAAKSLVPLAQRYLDQIKPLIERAGNEFAAGNYLALESYRDSIKISTENINNDVGAKFEPLLAKASSDATLKNIQGEITSIYDEALRHLRTADSYVSQARIIVRRQEQAAAAEAQRKAAEEAAAKAAAEKAAAEAAAKIAADKKAAEEAAARAAAAEEQRRKAEAEAAAAAEAKRRAQLAEAESKLRAQKTVIAEEERRKAEAEAQKAAMEKAAADAAAKRAAENKAAAEAEAKAATEEEQRRKAEAAAAEEQRRKAEAEAAAAAEEKRRAQLAEAEAKAAADKKVQEEQMRIAVENAKIEAQVKAEQEATAKADAEAKKKMMIYGVVAVVVLGAVGGGAYLALRKKN